MNESLKSSGANLAQIGVPARFRFSTGDLLHRQHGNGPKNPFLKMECQEAQW